MNRNRFSFYQFFCAINMNKRKMENRRRRKIPFSTKQRSNSNKQNDFRFKIQREKLFSPLLSYFLNFISLFFIGILYFFSISSLLTDKLFYFSLNSLKTKHNIHHSVHSRNFSFVCHFKACKMHNKKKIWSGKMFLRNSSTHFFSYFLSG